MMKAALERFARIWEGPAFTVRAGDVEQVLGQGDPKTIVTIHDLSIIRKMASNPSIVFGEAYMKGGIEIEGDIQDVLHGFYSAIGALEKQMAFRTMSKLKGLVTRRISQDAAIKNARHHYDIGNDFYKLWLDPSMAYTCAYYANENDDLETAQRQKFELVCRKARLQQGQSIIDLGCGWGGLIFHAVEHYDVQATGVVAAKEQAAFIEEEAKKRGVSDKVTVQLSDWRDAKGTYDRVLSVGMLEHVGLQQYGQFFGLVHALLSGQGIAFVHSIGRMTPRDKPDLWIDKYIFPGYFVPAPEEITHYAAAAGLHITDLENLWQHYIKTLGHWAENYEKNREKIIGMYDEEFDRMWWLYLQGSIAAFKYGGLNLWQMVMTKNKSVPWPLHREVGVGK